MKHFMLLVPACALAVAFGCGPMNAPLPERLDPETQKKIDDAWTGHSDAAGQAGTPGSARSSWSAPLRIRHGIDTLIFRSEKRFAGGKVVMEVAFDRTRPDDDRFEVTVLRLGREGSSGANATRDRRSTRSFNALFRCLTDDERSAA